MAVITANEIWEGRRGGDGIGFTELVYTRVFNVFTDDPHDGAELVLGAAGIPAVGDTFDPPSGEFDTDLLCVNVTAENNRQDRSFWQVRAEYIADTVNRAVLDPAEISWETELVPYAQAMSYPTDEMVAATTPTQLLFETSPTDDHTYTDPLIAGAYGTLPGNPVVNSAGQPFDPSPEVQRPLQKLIITRNEAASPLNTKRFYERSLNFDEFQGYAKGLAFMHSITGTKQHPTYGTKAYWKVRYEILFDPLGWCLKLNDNGFHYFNSVVGALYPITDVFNNQFPKAQPLNGSGNVLAGPPFTYVYGKFPIYRCLPWAILSLPDATT